MYNVIFYCFNSLKNIWIYLIFYLQREEDGGLKLTDLPDDCIRAILQRMPDAEDILNTGMTESRNQYLTQDELLWKALCLFHFTDIQMCTALRPTEKLENIQWKIFYRRLHK